MTLADLLKLAHEELRNFSPPHPLATAISQLLTANTCGWERPEVVDYRSALGGDEPRMIAVPESWATRVSPADARAMAVMLLNAASEAEEGSK